jgi:hypothetical protein
VQRRFEIETGALRQTGGKLDEDRIFSDLTKGVSAMKDDD